MKGIRRVNGISEINKSNNEMAYHDMNKYYERVLEADKKLNTKKEQNNKQDLKEKYKVTKEEQQKMKEKKNQDIKEIYNMESSKSRTTRAYNQLHKDEDLER